MRGHFREGRAWLEGALAFAASVQGGARADALLGCGLLALWQGDHDRADEVLAEALALGRELGDASAQIGALTNLGVSAVLAGATERAAGFYGEALALCRASGGPGELAEALQNLGPAARLLGDHARAEALLKEALALFRNLGDARNFAITHTLLAEVARDRGDAEGAARLVRKGLELNRVPLDRRAVAFSLVVATGLPLSETQPARAARLLGALDALGEAVGAFRAPEDAASHARAAVRVRATLGDEGFEIARDGGFALPPARVVEEALALVSGGAASQVGGGAQPLGPRELEVLGLIAGGSTTAEIAESLDVSKRTVAFHVSSIFAKLGAKSRAQAVALAIRRDLL